MLFRRLRLATALAFTFLSVVGSASASTWPPPPSDFFGINVNRLFNDGLPADVVDRQLAVVERSGMKVARTDAMWAYVQPQATSPLLGASWSETDRRMAALAAHHIAWQPVLDYTPKWQQTVSGDDKSAPKSNDAFAQFASAFAARYGQGGSFWSQHPELPYLPVRGYEIWNEENGTFWTPQPDPSDYADLFVRTADAIHGSDPGATVIVGGLVEDGGAFLRSMFSSRPDLAGRVGAVAYHPYAGTVDGVMASIDRLESTLAQLGQASLPVYVTEVGWIGSGTSVANPLVLSDPSRATSMSELVERIAASRVGDHLAGLTPYTFWTPEQNPADFEDWYGLWHADGSATPAGDAYVSAIARAIAAPPAVTTGAAPPAGTGQTSAVVAGSVNPGGCAASAQVQYATDSVYTASGGYDQASAPSGAGAASSDVPVSVTLAGLQPDTTYHYRLVATNACSSQTPAGVDGSFTTLPPNDLTITAVRQAADGTLVVTGLNGSRGRNSAKATTTARFKLGRAAGRRKSGGKAKKVAYASGSGATPGAGRFYLKLKPSARARALLRKRRKLVLSVTVTFSPARGAPNTKTTRVNVRLKRGRGKR